MALDLADFLDIARQHGQSHIALESVDAVIKAFIQAVYLQRINAGLDGRVRFTCGDKVIAAFPRRIGDRPFAFFSAA